jgi:hypothetical protein
MVGCSLAENQHQTAYGLASTSNPRHRSEGRRLVTADQSPDGQGERWKVGDRAVWPHREGHGKRRRTVEIDRLRAARDRPAHRRITATLSTRLLNDSPRSAVCSFADAWLNRRHGGGEVAPGPLKTAVLHRSIRSRTPRLGEGRSARRRQSAGRGVSRAATPRRAWAHMERPCLPRPRGQPNVPPGTLRDCCVTEYLLLRLRPVQSSSAVPAG